MICSIFLVNRGSSALLRIHLYLYSAHRILVARRGFVEKVWGAFRKHAKPDVVPSYARTMSGPAHNIQPSAQRREF